MAGKLLPKKIIIFLFLATACSNAPITDNGSPPGESTDDRTINSSGNTDLNIRWEGRSESGNVIDMRPRPCKNPRNCSAGFLSGECSAIPAKKGTKGSFNSGLCEVDEKGSVTSNCHVDARCCTNSSESPGVAGCDFKPVSPPYKTYPCDNSQCKAGKVIKEDKELCLKVVETGQCVWSWNKIFQSWSSQCDTSTSVITKENGCSNEWSKAKQTQQAEKY